MRNREREGGPGEREREREWEGERGGSEDPLRLVRLLVAHRHIHTHWSRRTSHNTHNNCSDIINVSLKW